jgi:hypothetical protein
VLFDYCPPPAIDPDYRCQLILAELTAYQADVMCLQVELAGRGRTCRLGPLGCRVREVLQNGFSLRDVWFCTPCISGDMQLTHQLIMPHSHPSLLDGLCWCKVPAVYTQEVDAKLFSEFLEPHLARLGKEEAW